jgi:hypothetical protein
MRKQTALTIALAMLSWVSASAADEPTGSVFWRLLRQTGVILETIASLGEGGAQRGAVWLAETNGHAERELMADPIYSHPVLDRGNAAVVALRGDDIVRFDIASQQLQVVASDVHVKTLIGIADGILLAILAEGPLGRLAMISPAGQISALPAPKTEEELRTVAFLGNESRVYAGGRGLIVDRSDQGFDVFLVTGDDRRDVSNCGKDACGQPAMSDDAKQIVYIRSPNPH